MKWYNPHTYNCEISFDEDIYGSYLFYNIRRNFGKKIINFIPSVIIENKKKNIDRIIDNLFCHWYFWESYISKYNNYHPLLLQENFSYKSLKNILNDYYENDGKDFNFEIIKNELKLREEFDDAINKLKTSEIKISYNLISINYYKISIYVNNLKFFFSFSLKKGNEIINKIGKENFIRLIFRYYVLGSNNNQLAAEPDLLRKINCDVELFASGFNNYNNLFCSIFPDLEKHLGSIGRFQDLEINYGRYQINPPFQTTMIYSVLDRLNEILKKKSNIKFYLFLPDWSKDNKQLKYSKYMVFDKLKNMETSNIKVDINKLDCNKLNYIDYWKEKIRNKTLPDTLFIKLIKN